jgi:hypothetical protein
MMTGENRRTFLSALILAGGSAGAFAESYRHDAGQPVNGDPLFEHIQQQLAGMLRTAQTRGVGLGAEDAAAAAACMRICAAHARGLNLDQGASDALARRLVSTTRDALIVATPDLTTLREQLRQKGLILGDRVVREVSNSDRGARAAALDMIREGRASLVCDRLAEALEVAAPRITNRQGPLRRVATADDWWCNFYISQWSMYLAIAWYIWSFQDPALQEFLESAWAGFGFYEQLYSSEC